MSTVVSKRYDAAAAKVDREKPYSVEEAIATLKGMPAAKFDESVDLSFRLGVDPKHADQMVRGAVVLPNGIGKTVRVAVFAKGEKEREAREAGADVVGAEDLVEKVQGGFMEFDTTIATPDLMGQVGRLGKVLGPIGFVWATATGRLPLQFGLVILMNNVVWWPAFVAYLRRYAARSVSAASITPVRRSHRRSRDRRSAAGAS